MLIRRKELEKKIKELLKEKSLVWLSGVRRTGKTTLCKSLSNIKYFDCELPSVRAELEDPEFFWSKQEDKLVVLDEVHKLKDPSNFLKIATDHYPKVQIVATGSSTLGAKKKFKDTLTDRKRDLWMHAFLYREAMNSSNFNLDQYLLFGQLPPAFLAKNLNDNFYIEWLDSFWAKDIQELFSIDKKASFTKLAELILRQSGEIFEANSFADPCEISRQTVKNYLDILVTTHFALVVKPYSNNRDNDIKSAPKVYGFDTGFVCFSRNWNEIHSKEKGNLLEHIVLYQLLADFKKNNIYYWRNKQKNEVDFVIKPNRGKEIHAIECKNNYHKFSARNLKVFRNAYPKGKNFLIAANLNKVMELKIEGIEIIALPLSASVDEFI